MNYAEGNQREYADIRAIDLGHIVKWSNWCDGYVRLYGRISTGNGCSSVMPQCYSDGCRV